MALSRSEMEALIVQRAWKDDAFRDEFVADPKATIEKYSGQKLPAELKIVALAEDDKTIHFVIPPKPANADELSDEDLEKVAGGIDFIVPASLPASRSHLPSCGALPEAGERAGRRW